MTQNEKILRHLQDHGEITPAEAYEDYGVYRLAARIADLRKVGYDITSYPTTGRNRYGEATRYTTYRLEAGS